MSGAAENQPMLAARHDLLDRKRKVFLMSKIVSYPAHSLCSADSHSNSRGAGWRPVEVNSLRRAGNARGVTVRERTRANRLDSHGVRDWEVIEHGADGLQENRRELFFVFRSERRNESDIHDGLLYYRGGRTVIE
jgi:hypothetical protein